MRLHTLLLYLFLIGISQGVTAREVKVKSPDGKAVVWVAAPEHGNPTWRVMVDGTPVLSPSQIGYESANGAVPGKGWKLLGVKTLKHKGEWKPLWGKRAVVPEVYAEAQLTYAKGSQQVSLQIRAYNDAVAWRMVNLQGTDSWKETSDFCFAGDYTAWYYNGEYHNLGPEKLSLTEGERMPVVTLQAHEHLFLALHEAALFQGKPLLLQKQKGTRTFQIVSEDTPMKEGQSMAWRVLLYGTTPGALVDSHTLELLNPDPQEGMDFSWVKPGTYLWDWRINGAEWEGFRYKLNYDSWVRMVDFAAEQGFSGFVLDANWYGPEFEKNSDPVKGEKARDVQRIIQYGKQKNVALFLYLNDVAGTNYPIEETLKQYESWGAAGVKYGFMEGTPTERNEKTIRITELCAKHHLCVDYHDGPVHPFGQSRTWPNAITREYCQAQLDAHRVFQPKTFVTSVFVNMIAGPLDMNNGFFELHQGKTTRKDNNQEVPATVCAEAARTLITYSGATVIPDIPEYYKKFPALLEFLASQKQPWQESRTLNGEIGKYIVMVRRAASGKYLLAAATNEEARTLTVDLSFLPKGNYTARITEDGQRAHYQTNREETQTRTLSVSGGKKAGTLELHLAPGGGACVIFE